MCLGLFLGGFWPGLGILALFAGQVLSFWRILPRWDRRGAMSVPMLIAASALHFAMLCAVAINVASFSGAQAIVALVAAGLWYGQISRSVAHELIRKPSRRLPKLGTTLFASLIYGHHASAYVHVHRANAATPYDPYTASIGEGYWAFTVRAWLGAYQSGFEAEKARLDGSPLWRHPYVVNWGLCAATIAMFAALGGWKGLAGFLILALLSQLQFLVADYVRHYGLSRTPLPGGGFKPLGKEHAWYATDDDGALSADASAEGTRPTLPLALPFMMAIALVPPLWHRLMDHRADAWHDKSIETRFRQIAS